MAAKRKNERTRVRKNVARKPAPAKARSGKRSSRAELLQRTMKVAKQLDRPRSVTEIADGAGIHWRTVYRILEDLEASGWTIEKTKAAPGGGRAATLFVATRRGDL